MELILELPEENVSWYSMLIESIENWWMKRRNRDFEENDLLID